MSLMRSCPELFQLQQLLLGRVRAREAEQLERHLDECSACSARLEEVDVEDALLQTMRQRSAILAAANTALTEQMIEQMRHWNPSRPSRTDQGATVALDFLDSPQAPEELGRLGPYRILHPLGRGGTGVVLLAEDLRLRRLVALKVILEARYADPRSLVRFEQEGAVLARLRHPNVVQIYEVGEHRGRPYLALEYVSGGTLAQLLSGQPQPVHDAAALVAALARAVQHAHEHGVIHRDLKPANVLLASDCVPEKRTALAGFVPKITDFGLARCLDEDGETKTGDLLGTPGYMAPELTRGQARGSGVAVDVYSLGAMFYELLTGRPPFRGETVVDTLEQARTLEPVSPRRLRPALPRDVETICLKCLEKDPGHRYSSALALADDLERYLVGQPIHARSVSLPIRLGKWVRRQPALAALMTIIGLFVITLVVGSLIYQAQLRSVLAETRRQEQRAEANYREARDTLQRMLQRTLQRGGSGIPKLQELRREQQEDALAFFLKMIEQNADDPAKRFETAQAHHEAGMLQRTLGRSEEASLNFERAEEMLARLAAEFPGERSYRYRHAEALKLLAATKEQAPAATENGYRRALERTEELLREEPNSVEYRAQHADVHITFGSSLVHRGNKPEAEGHYRRAVAVYEALAAEQPDERRHRLVLARVYVNLSEVMQTTQRSPKEFHDRAEQTLEQLHHETPHDDEVIDALAVLRVNWAYVLLHENKSEAALEELRKNRAMLTEALQREPSHAVLRDRLYRTHGVCSTVYEAQQRFAEAGEETRRVVELSATPAQADFHRLFLAMYYARAGKHEPAMNEIEDWATRVTPTTPDNQLLHAAKVAGTALNAVSHDPALTDAARESASKRCTTRTLDFLRQTRKAAGEANWKALTATLSTEESFRLLRANLDFQRLTDAE